MLRERRVARLPHQRRWRRALGAMGGGLMGMSAPPLTRRSGMVEVRIPVRSPQIAPLELSGFQRSAVQCSDLLPGRANDAAGRHLLHPPPSSRFGKRRNNPV